MALSGEEDINTILEMILIEARELTRSDAGSLYMINDEGNHLNFVVLHNDTMNTRMGGTSCVEINLPPVPLYVDGHPNHANVSSHVALTGEIINIADVYESEEFDFTGPRKYDESTGYRSKSMLVIPMRNHENAVIGVMQLLNAQEPVGGEVIDFSDDLVVLVASLASQAAAALTKTRLIQDLKGLFYSFIKSIAGAIEEKSPYTGGHINRVVDLTMMMARKIDQVDEGPFADVHFSEDDLEQLKLAAWLHDVGKITTPEYVVDKASKLETLCDRISTVEMRFKYIAKCKEAEYLERIAGLAGNGDGSENLESLMQEMRKIQRQIEDDLEFVKSCNNSGEFLSDENLQRLKAIAAKTFELDGKTLPYLTEDELNNLCIRKGTLNQEERKIIEGHATMTGKILAELPFPDKLCRVPEFASGHHEKMDGSGYPLGLNDRELSLEARIMAVADIFEALTAKDRPYKKPMTLSQAVKILGFMKKDSHIDPDIHDMFMSTGLFMEYAAKELLPWQIDDVDVQPNLKKMKVMIVAGKESAAALQERLSSWGAEPEMLEPDEAVKRLSSAFGRRRPYRFAFLETPLFKEQEREKLRKLAAKPGFPAWSLILLGPDDNKGMASALGENAVALDLPIDSDRLKERIGRVLAEPQIGKAALHPRNTRRVKKQKQGTHILVADHSANTRMLIKYFLNDLDFVVDMAETPQEALKRYQANNYDVVVMGMEFPENGGHGAVESIRAWEREADLPARPIIGLIPHYEREGAKQCVAIGCSASLIKPVTKDNLGKVISHYLKD